MSSLPSSALGEQITDDQRGKFKKAWQLVNAGRLSAAEALVTDLETYPLHIYLRAAQLAPTLQKANNPPLEDFLAQNAGSYSAEKLRGKWLKWLASANHWQTFLTHYRPQSDTSLQCAHKTALLKTNRKDGLFQQILPLWTVGKSQPQDCDQVFKFFESHQGFGDPVVWQRFRAAMANKKVGLARYLAKKFKNVEAKTWAERWVSAHQNPDAVLKRDYVLGDAMLARDVLFHALSRLARANFNAAEKHWVRLSASEKLAVEDVNRGHMILAVAAGKAEHKNQVFYLDQVENQFADSDLESLRLRRGIQLGAWQALHRWTSSPPVNPSTNALRWRYWHARSAELIGQPAQAKQAYATLARERDYYGFVAADKLQQPYRYNDQPINPSADELANLLARPGIIRAKEFFELAMHREANREWYWTNRKFQ